MKHTFRFLLTLGMVITIALASVAPVFAEDAPPPPPAGNPDGSGGGEKEDGGSASTANTPEESLAPSPGEEVDNTDFTSQPNYDPGGAATSGLGAFQGEVLVNTAGNPVTEGTDLAALAVGTAYACPPGTLPDFLVGGTCSALTNGFTTAQAAANFALPGWTIWLTNYFSDGQDLIVQKPLTIQGSPLGSGYLGNAGANPAIYVQASNVTIRDIYALGYVNSIDNGGTLRLQDIFVSSPNAYALYVNNHSGSVIVSQYFAYDTDYGAYINTLAGTGTVTVVNSSFESTDFDNGLEIYARNAVKLENVNASYNHWDGAYIQYAKGLSVKNSMFNNNDDGVSDYNYGYGLRAYDIGPSYGYARAPVLLQSVLAQQNDEDGIYLENTGTLTVQTAGLIGNEGHGMYVDGYSSGTLDGVVAMYNAWMYGEGVHLWLSTSTTVSNSAIESNYYDGLLVITGGAVTLKGNKVAYNWGDGADIDTAGAVSVQGGYYDSNTSSGLTVETFGSITLNGIVATWNQGSVDNTAAVDLDNCQWDGSKCLGAGGVTITNSLGQNIISDNYKKGLVINSRGTVSINTLTANDNVNSAITIDNCQYSGVLGKCAGIGNVTLTNVAISDAGQNDIGSGTPIYSAYGAYIYSGGSITLDKVSAQRSTAYGIWVDNSNAVGKSIMLKNVYALDNNGVGVSVWTAGPVSINHINSIYNNGKGLELWTYLRTYGVSISNTLGANIVDNNQYGVDLEAAGTVTITGLSASGNYTGYGLYLKADYGTGSVTISNSRFNANSTYGMEVYAKGNITLSSVQANTNYNAQGAWLHNESVAGKSVTVNKGSFNFNDTRGLEILSGGNVTLNGVSASNNGEEGVYIVNDYFGGLAAYNVTISSSLGVNMFNNNGMPLGDSNVYIRTAGNVTVSKATANNHYDGNMGFMVYHTGNWSGKKVTFTCSTADYNWNYGYYIFNAGGFPIGVYLNGSSATGNWSNYIGSGAVSWFFTRTNCP